MSDFNPDELREYVEALCALQRAQFDALSPEEQRAHRREQAIDWAFGNLMASTNHHTTREIVAAAYDRLHPQ